MDRLNGQDCAERRFVLGTVFALVLVGGVGNCLDHPEKEQE